MIAFRKIFYLIVAFCILQWFICMVESAPTVGDSKGEASYATTDNKKRVLSSAVLDSIYGKNRQSRCVTCYEDRRYDEDRSRSYGGYAARPADDRGRNWYYPSYGRYDDRGYDYDRYTAPVPDRYEYDRYGADRYSTDRYGADRYGGDKYGTSDRYSGYRYDYSGGRQPYDRYNSRSRSPYEKLPSAYDRGESRGYGYDNRDPYYGNDRAPSDYYGRDRYYERRRYGPTSAGTAGYGGYNRDYYDRYSMRGQSGYNSGDRGSYNDRQPQEDQRYLGQPGYNSPCGIRRPNCPYGPPEEGTRVSSSTIESGHYNMGVSQSTYNTNPNRNQNESSQNSDSPGSWSYVREEEQNSRSNTSSNSGSKSNSERQSSGYGALLDRGSNLIAVEPAKSNANQNANDTMPSSDMQNDKNADEASKQSDNRQNS